MAIDDAAGEEDVQNTQIEGTQGVGETELMSPKPEPPAGANKASLKPDEEPALSPAAGDSFYRFRRAAPAVLATAYAKLLLRLAVDRKFDFSELLLASETGLPIREVERTMPELVRDGFALEFDQKGHRYYHFASAAIDRVGKRLRERASR